MMILAYVILALLICCCPPFRYGFSKDYLSPTNTAVVKGLCIVVVFLRHFGSYVNLTGIGNLLFLRIDAYIGQLCVVMFLFYSGYGIWYSYMNKRDYVKTFMTHRFLPVWISFAICVLFYLIEDMLIGKEYSIQNIFLSFTGWKSIGNSNWYMFVTFVLYIMFYLCFIKCSRNKVSDSISNIYICIYSFSCLLLVIILSSVKESYWYNTILCFPAGMWYCVFKERIDDWIQKNNKRYILTLLLLFCLFLVCYKFKHWNGLIYNAASILFALCSTLITMKFTFRSSPFAFLGRHVFSIYMLQRLCFNAAQYHGLNQKPYLFFIVCFLSTITLAVCYDSVFNRLKAQLIRKTAQFRETHEIKKENTGNNI